MVGEDFRSQAYHNMMKYVALKEQSAAAIEQIDNLTMETNKYKRQWQYMSKEYSEVCMEKEDYLSYIQRADDTIESLKEQIHEHEDKIEELTTIIKKKDNTIRGRDTQIQKLNDAVAGAHDRVKELEEAIEELENGGERKSPDQSPTKVKDEVEKEDQEVQTDIMMDYFD